MYLNPKYMKIKYGKNEKMRFGAVHTPRRNMVNADYRGDAREREIYIVGNYSHVPLVIMTPSARSRCGEVQPHGEVDLVALVAAGIRFT